jgi:hypothetical protein
LVIEGKLLVLFEPKSGRWILMPVGCCLVVVLISKVFWEANKGSPTFDTMLYIVRYHFKVFVPVFG